jgi:hypothetical protein
MPFLTDAIIRALPLPAKGNKVHFDQPNPDIPETADVVTVGLGIRVTAAGHRAWVFRYRLKDGSGDYRKLTLGRYPHLSISNVRKRARKLREEIEGGADPQGEKTARRSVPTIAKLADDFDAEQMAQVRAGELRMSTREGYRRLQRRSSVCRAVSRHGAASAFPNRHDAHRPEASKIDHLERPPSKSRPL